jgi:hypothetical protein
MNCQQTRDTYLGYNNPRSLYLLRILGTVNIVKIEGNVIAACRTIYAKLFDEKPSNVSDRISVGYGKVVTNGS